MALSLNSGDASDSSEEDIQEQAQCSELPIGSIGALISSTLKRKNDGNGKRVVVVVDNQSRMLLQTIGTELVKIISKQCIDEINPTGSRPVTMTQKDVSKAANDLGLCEYAASDLATQPRPRKMKKNRLTDSGLSMEELEKQQQALIDQARKALLAEEAEEQQQSSSLPVSCSTASGSKALPPPEEDDDEFD